MSHTRITKTRSAKALRTALDLTSRGTLKTDIYEAACTATDYEHLEKIAAELDPKAAQDASALTAAC